MLALAGLGILAYGVGAWTVTPNDPREEIVRKLSVMLTAVTAISFLTFPAFAQLAEDLNGAVAAELAGK